MLIKLNLDTQQFNEKPKKAEIGGISNRMRTAAAIREIEAASLKDYVTKGISFTPAVLDGANKENWQQQQLICIDVDNEDFLKNADGSFVYEMIDGKNKQVRVLIDNPTAPGEAIYILKKYKIEPFLVYKSFSYQENWQRYRIVILLAEPLTDVEKMRDYTRRLAALINGADTGIATPERMIFGGRSDSVLFSAPDNITDIATLESLPAYIEPKQNTAPSIIKTKDFVDPLNSIQKMKSRNAANLSTAEMQQRLKEDIKNFDLMAFITETTNAKPVKIGNALYATPCPICGRDSNNCQINNNSWWYCYDAFNTTGIKGGTIIDYLMAVYGLSNAEAMAKFEYDIMGYDLAEKKTAYKEEKKAEEIELMEKFKAAHKTADNQPQQELEAEKQPKKDDIERFLENITSTQYKPHSTGIKWFDDLLGGGLVDKRILFLLAAPSAGKTTLCQQIAENMAAKGTPFIFFNWEMSQDAMLAKSISCALAKNDYYITSDEIMRGYNWNDEQRKIIIDAVANYKEYVYPHIKFNPDNIAPHPDKLREYLNEIGKRAQDNHTKAPAIVIDYLHLITDSSKNDIKEVIKDSVEIIRNYVTHYNTFAICISATNRETNKSGTMSMASARDSSNIEYGADYVITLNYYEVDRDIINPDERNKMSNLKRRRLRNMLIYLDKNRYGATGIEKKVYFNAANNIFYGENELSASKLQSFNSSKTIYFDNAVPFNTIDFFNAQKEDNAKDKKAKNKNKAD